MPFVRGNPKPTGSGRKKGAPAKRINVGHTQMARDVSERLAALNCDPIEGMARLALDKTNEAGLRGRMFAELAQYVYPKRKAVELSGPGGAPIEHSVDAFEKITRELARISERERPPSDPQPLHETGA